MKIAVKKTLIEQFEREFRKGGLPVGTVHGDYKKVSDNPSEWERVKKDRKMGTPVQHDGEYVLTASGSRDFGEITSEIGRAIKRQAGKIRLRIGIEQKGNKGNFGEKHIERPARLAQMRSAGFECARDLVEAVCHDFDEIYENGRDLLLYKYGANDVMAYVELAPMPDGEFYDVKTALPTRRTFIKNKTPVWSKGRKQ